MHLGLKSAPKTRCFVKTGDISLPTNAPYHLENKHKPSSTPHRGACGCLPKWHLKRAMIRLEKPERNRVISRLMHIRKAVKRMKCLEAIL